MPIKKKILVFIPMYNCARQIPRVLDQLNNERVNNLIDGVLCVDNRSTDETLDVAKKGLESSIIKNKYLIINNNNYGLGGSHKVAIEFGLQNNYEHIVVLHGDDQGSINDVLDFLEKKLHEKYDFLLGARFMPKSELIGYSPIRIVANNFFNILFSQVSGKKLYDLGSGLNVFNLNCFKTNFHYKFSDDLTFNYYLILAIVYYNFNFSFFPLTWREVDQVSNAKLTKMGVQLFKLIGFRVINKNLFFKCDHRNIKRKGYTYSIINLFS